MNGAVAGSSIVQIRNLTVDYIRGGFLKGPIQRVRALNNVSLDVNRGETLGVVGESGCGKTTLGRALLRLIQPAEGEIWFDGVDWLRQDPRSLRVRRRDLQIIFQNPTSSLDPRMKVFNLVAEPLRAQTTLAAQALRDRVAQLLAIVGLPQDLMDRYPRELSGGQAQRIAIARALSLEPKFVVLDEPTSALDVSVQAQIINLLVQLQRDKGLTYLFISHDLPVVQYVSQRLAVMYLGEVVELAPSRVIFAEALHPYTQALLSATPSPVVGADRKRIVLEGSVPNAANPPSGCPFHTRCPIAVERCTIEKPHLVQIAENHWVSCHLTAPDAAT